MGRQVIPDENLPQKVQDLIRSMEDSCTSEGTFLAELINDVADSAIYSEDDPKDAMISTLNEVIEWANSTKKKLEVAFK